MLALFSTSVCAQLGNKHWLPPVHSRTNEDVEDHYVYLSTPEEDPFVVTLVYGGTTVQRTISSGSPAQVLIGADKPSAMFTADSELNTPTGNKGVVLTAPKEFYASFRVRSPAQAGYLTTKGEEALGMSFRLGSLPQSSEVEDKNFFASFMATEDNTTITVSDYDNGVVFAGPNPSASGTVQVVLDQNETYTVSGYTTFPSNHTGFIGALVVSDKPIVVNTGNGLGGFETNSRDYTIDQIVPVEDVGNEYIVIEGNGNRTTERPLVVATEPNTQIFVNGVPYVNLAQAGDYILIPNSRYQGSSHRNMYITSDKNIYVYQFLAGDTNEATVGMNFIPPLSCFFQKEVDLIPDVDRIGGTSYEGDIIAITRSGATLTVNGVDVADSPQSVGGTGDWETYRLSGYTGNVAVASTKPIAIGLFGFNGAAGFGGYYSGFGSIPKNTETEVCDFTITDLFEEIDGNPDPGGVWTDPNSMQHSGFFDPQLDILGTYNYYLDTGCAIIDVDLTITGIVLPKDPGEDNSIILCVEDGPVDLFAHLNGNPDPDGEWRDSDGMVFSGLFDPSTFSEGTYTYGFYENEPCEPVEATITVGIASAPDSVEVSSSKALFSNRPATLTVNVIGGAGLFEYQLDDGFWQEDATFTEVGTGKHIVSARSKYGCGDIQSNTITTVVYPSFFSPNGDNVNETWKIEMLSEELQAEIYIFNRYGKLLQQIDPYGGGWNGQMGNNLLPSDDYWFRIVYTENDQRESFQSHFSLKR